MISASTRYFEHWQYLSGRHVDIACKAVRSNGHGWADSGCSGLMPEFARPGVYGTKAAWPSVGGHDLTTERAETYRTDISAIPWARTSECYEAPPISLTGPLYVTFRHSHNAH